MKNLHVHWMDNKQICTYIFSTPLSKVLIDKSYALHELMQLY